jgi:hypothetical protein
MPIKYHIVKKLDGKIHVYGNGGVFSENPKNPLDFAFFPKLNFAYLLESGHKDLGVKKITSEGEELIGLSY